VIENEQNVKAAHKTVFILSQSTEKKGITGRWSLCVWKGTILICLGRNGHRTRKVPVESGTEKEKSMESKVPRGKPGLRTGVRARAKIRKEHNDGVQKANNPKEFARRGLRANEIVTREPGIFPGAGRANTFFKRKGRRGGKRRRNEETDG